MLATFRVCFIVRTFQRSSAVAIKGSKGYMTARPEVSQPVERPPLFLARTCGAQRGPRLRRR